MFRNITRWFRGPEGIEVAAPQSVEVAPDPRGAPGTRVYHEYFVDDEPSPDGKWSWLARVYAQNGAVTEQAGIADARDIARNAALSWCAKTKAGLRGEV